MILTFVLSGCSIHGITVNVDKTSTNIHVFFCPFSGHFHVPILLGWLCPMPIFASMPIFMLLRCSLNYLQILVTWPRYFNSLLIFFHSVGFLGSPHLTLEAWTTGFNWASMGHLHATPHVILMWRKWGPPWSHFKGPSHSFFRSRYVLHSCNKSGLIEHWKPSQQLICHEQN